ncbi:MAG: BatD family protein [Limisphaerales bacterium]
MSSIISITYPMTARRVGEFTIPAMTADVNGQLLATAPLTLVVTKARAPSTSAVNSGGEIAFLKFTFPKNETYLGEATIAQLELYLRDDVQNFGNFQLTSLPTDGFSTGKIIEFATPAPSRAGRQPCLHGDSVCHSA